MEITQNNIGFGNIIIEKGGEKYIQNMIRNGKPAEKLAEKIQYIIKSHEKIKDVTINITENGPYVKNNINGKTYYPTGEILKGKYTPSSKYSREPIEYELSEPSSTQYTQEDLNNLSKYNSDFLFEIKPVYERKSEKSYLSYIGSDMSAKINDKKMRAALDIANDTLTNVNYESFIVS